MPRAPYSLPVIKLWQAAVTQMYAPGTATFRLSVGGALLLVAQLAQRHHDKVGTKVVKLDGLGPGGADDAHAHWHEEFTDEARDGLTSASRLIDAVDDEDERSELVRL